MVGVVAALIVLGHAWGNWWFGPGWPIGLVAIAAVLYLVSRDRNRGTVTPASYGPYAGSYPATGYAATSAAPGGTVTAPAPETGAEPPADAMPRPRRGRRGARLRTSPRRRGPAARA